MPDHFHALVSFPADRAMNKVVSNWKEIIAQQTAVAWQRDFFDRRLRAHESYDQQAHDIRMNPVRAGLVAEPAQRRFIWEPHSAGRAQRSRPTLKTGTI
ncbi:MAG: hypothetical protein H7343_04210 [Undibacterium sp.]|nr:hypothetical protein [Opitutaceae bacterium]